MLLALSRVELWSDWMRQLAVIAAAAYALRAATLFTDSGPFAPDGLLGIYVPVGALAGWILLASLDLMKRNGAFARATGGSIRGRGNEKR